MASAGEEGTIYQLTGLAHNEKGRPSFDFANNQRMREKRCQKLAPLRDRDDLVKVFGKEQARKGIVTFGSSAQFVLILPAIIGVGEFLVSSPVRVPHNRAKSLPFLIRGNSNADPFALTLTMSCMEAFNFIGPPEGYLALANRLSQCLVGGRE
jgi:hypothetical protein